MSIIKGNKSPESKRLAVEMRLQEQPLAEIKRATGLSAPTIIGLHKAYLDKGWDGVRARQAGRPPKTKDSNPTNYLQHQLIILQKGLPRPTLWTKENLAEAFSGQMGQKVSTRKALSILGEWGWELETFATMTAKLTPEDRVRLDTKTDTKKFSTLAVNNKTIKIENLGTFSILYSRDSKNKIAFKLYPYPLKDGDYVNFYECLHNQYPQGIYSHLMIAGLQYTPKFASWLRENAAKVIALPVNPSEDYEKTKQFEVPAPIKQGQKIMSNTKPAYTHLQQLEAESIHIMREVVAEATNPVMLYSIGKDSAVMLHLALKAFYPAKLPFPVLHVDTLWKFQDMYRFRAEMTQRYQLDLLIHSNQEGIEMGINPFTHGSQIHTDIMKTQGLKQALDKYQFDVAFGGARRDEEKSRAKERIFSFRNAQHHWDPKQQRPELWNLYNAKKNAGQSIRVFPISNWTELDIWQYIYQENIPIVPLYFAKKRPVVNRGGTWIMVDDERMPLAPGEVPEMKSVRFRTLGCYPLTGAIESQAATLPEIIQEMLLTKTSERQGRVIDHDGAASMEKKKQEGYF